MSDVFDLFGGDDGATGHIAVPALAVPALPDEPRERFRVLRAYLANLKSMAYIGDLQQQFDAELRVAVAALPATAPKKGRQKERTPHEALGEEKYAEIRAKYEEVITRTLAVRKVEAERVDGLLHDLADTLTVTSGDTWTKRADVSSMDYGSQGLGAHTYARASADCKAEHYAIAGLKTEVRARWLRDEHPDDPRWKRSDLAHYEVWVQASEEDCEIASFKAGLSFKDWLQWNWDRAINPRVLLPGLPWGLEEKLGVVIGRVRSNQGG